MTIQRATKGELRMDVVRRRIVQAVLVARGISATDFNCLLGAAETGEPDVLTRGGDFLTGPSSGHVVPVQPSLSFDIIGFRCAR